MITLSRYGFMVFIQLFLLAIDLCINTFSDFAYNDAVTLLILFIIQDVLLVFGAITFFLSLFSTFVFQAGFLGSLFRQFRATVFICATYVTLTVSYHILVVRFRWQHMWSLQFPNCILALYVCQRILAVFYYYFYKRTVLRLSDPRFYEDFDVSLYEKQ
ncbi:transmembrane protein 138 [Schistocerca americana]|uniref:transmembrane protein 138 n=1 Tax=Schistocerca americana TaxID=7009 RepID=UPI001F50387B|nr:transmembrane protein 138 [Schistocerca americana]XP_047118891.1 transmembrane protein 138 [Schistocerca piceifrons]XP_049764656.1 transmembrane protein 138 [Schistocerca cancellata]XP_049799464.1 transmembrane protein 138 [Schistocerca nitens]XP_049837359.1 transmembrane protein 138 [Schistocerca gregaria]XP_049951824.1 transmembrane protein 138 [Schistocerca serialis cubense]